MRRYEKKRRFFDESAPLWEQRDFDDRQRRIAEHIVRQAGVKPGMTVLEPGCGAGRMTRLLADAVGRTGRVVAVDISEKMVAAARAAVSADRVEIHHLAVEDLNLPADSVDVILCFDVFPHFEDPGEVLDRFGPMLKPEGRLIAAHCPGRTAVNDLHKRVGGAVGADRLPAAAEMEALFRSHGFAVRRLLDEADFYYLEATLIAA